MRPTLGVSACLLGQKVRYDGEHARSDKLMEILECIEAEAICPESEIGLGVPRPPMHLTRDGARTRLVVTEDGRDLTVAMQRFADRRISSVSPFWRLASAIIALVLAASCSRPHPATTANAAHVWPMFRGDASHRGQFPGRAPPSGRVRWTAELGERVDASPLIDSSGAVWIATRRGTIARLDGRTGAIQLRRKLAGGVWATPALVGGVIVVASDRGELIALDQRTLATRWRTRAPAKSFSALTPSAGRILVCSGRRLLFIAASDGAIERAVELGAASFTAPALSPDGAVAVVATRAGEVLAVSTATGEIDWRSQTTAGAHNDGSPAIADGKVFVGSNDQSLHAFELASGRHLWRSRGRDWVVDTPAVAAGLVIYGDDGGLLRAVSVADGALRWRARVGGDLASSPTLLGSVIVHGAHDGKLWAHDSQTGQPHFSPIELGAAAYSSIALADDGSVVIATHAGRVIAIE